MADLIISQPMTFTVDVKNGLVERPQRESLMRGDKMANRIIAELVYGSEPFDITGVTVKGKFCRPPSGDEIDLVGEAKGNVAEVQLTDQCYTSGGHYEARVILVLGGVERTVLFISGDVLKSGSGNAASDEETGGSGGSTGSGLPAGGTAGQVLVKVSSAQGDAIWKTLTAADVGARPADWMPTAADVGALPSDGTAVNATQLNGKGAEYYTNPRNLLRNANFRDPVNTVGFSSGSTVGAWAGEMVNEWLAYASGATITLTSSGMSILNGIYQEMSAVDLSRYAGKALTFAAKINGVVYAVQGVVNQTGAWHILGESVTPYGRVRAEIQDDNKLFCIIVNDTEATVEWAALYEGSYTADNVPPPFIYPKRLEMLRMGLPTQPRNLLDNSDFTRFIAQAGIMGMHGAVQYGGDRWKLFGGTVTGIANADGDGYTDITLKDGSRIDQIVAGIDKYYGQPMTAALWLSDGSVIVGSAVVDKPTADYQTPIGISNGNGTNVYLQAGTGTERRYSFIISADSSAVTIRAAALLPGSYTADNLPPYVPKGYAVELAECQRYYYEEGISNESIAMRYQNTTSAAVNAYATGIRVYFPVEMRLTPTVEITFVISDGEAITMDGSFVTKRSTCLPNYDIQIGAWFDLKRVTASADL